MKTRMMTVDSGGIARDYGTQPYTHEAWRGRIRASAGVAASLDPEAVARFDAEHAKLRAERFPGEPVLAPHRVFALIGRKPLD